MSRMRIDRTRSASLVFGLLLLLPACGGDDGGGNGGGGDGGPVGEDPCGFDSDDYLPYEAGFTWTYRVTDLGTGARETKEQRIDPEMEHPDYGAVLVQVTSKVNGETVNFMQVQGDRVVRRQQEDYDASGALERTTVYQPHAIRIDQSPERTTPDAMWQEDYTEVVTEPGVAPIEVPTTDVWLVVEVDVPCESPLGIFECIRLRRTRTQGGVAEKEFFFARGVGKVREVGSNQLEELSACGAE